MVVKLTIKDKEKLISSAIQYQLNGRAEHLSVQDKKNLTSAIMGVFQNPHSIPHLLYKSEFNKAIFGYVQSSIEAVETLEEDVESLKKELEELRHNTVANRQSFPNLRLDIMKKMTLINDLTFGKQTLWDLGYDCSKEKMIEKFHQIESCFKWTENALEVANERANSEEKSDNTSSSIDNIEPAQEITKVESCLPAEGSVVADQSTNSETIFTVAEIEPAKETIEVSSAMKLEVGDGANTESVSVDSGGENDNTSTSRGDIATVEVQETIETEAFSAVKALEVINEATDDANTEAVSIDSSGKDYSVFPMALSASAIPVSTTTSRGLLSGITDFFLRVGEYAYEGLSWFSKMASQQISSLVEAKEEPSCNSFAESMNHNTNPEDEKDNLPNSSFKEAECTLQPMSIVMALGEDNIENN